MCEESAAPDHQGDNHSPKPRRLLTVRPLVLLLRQSEPLILNYKNLNCQNLPQASLLWSILQVHALSLPAPILLVHYLNSQQNHN